jgi:4-hydroxythreonine-4-phosphate dehydrogenase
LRPGWRPIPTFAKAVSLTIVGDARVLARGAETAGVTLDLATGEGGDGPVLRDLGHLDPASIALGVAAEAGGRFALANFRTCLEMAMKGEADAVCFTPFNKAAMRLADPAYDDEISYVSRVLGLSVPASEFNVLDRLWNARVTSHVPAVEGRGADHRRRTSCAAYG